MDLSVIQPSESILEIVHPGTETKLGITVSLRSIDDEAMKKAKRLIQNENLRLQRRGKSFDADQLDENQSKLMFAAMTGWTWGQHAVRKGDVATMEDTTFHGEKPTFNQENVLKVFAELPWFRDQIVEKVGDTSSFFTK